MVATSTTSWRADQDRGDTGKVNPLTCLSIIYIYRALAAALVSRKLLSRVVDTWYGYWTWSKKSSSIQHRKISR